MKNEKVLDALRACGGNLCCVGLISRTFTCDCCGEMESTSRAVGSLFLKDDSGVDRHHWICDFCYDEVYPPRFVGTTAN